MLRLMLITFSVITLQAPGSVPVSALLDRSSVRRDAAAVHAAPPSVPVRELLARLRDASRGLETTASGMGPVRPMRVRRTLSRPV